MNFEMVKNFMAEVGWGFLATSDGNQVWIGNELWAATRAGSEKIAQLRKIPYAGSSW
jgi:hypothetical protein